MNAVTTTRRTFVKLAATAAAASLVVPLRMFAAESSKSPGLVAAVGPWIEIAADGTITLFASQAEMGQGIHTGLAQILADELEADWGRIRVVPAPVGGSDDYRITIIGFKSQMTGGSSSTTLLHLPLRRAGAAAREMLVETAATAWAVPAEECEGKAGRVVHGPSGRTLDYGQLAAGASRLPIPANPRLKKPEAFRYIGKSVPRVDVPAKVDGSAVFGLDVVVPEMLIGLVKHAPVIGGKLASSNAAEVLKMPGIRAVVNLGDAEIVVADTWFDAYVGIFALKQEITAPAGPVLSSELIAEKQQAALDHGTGIVTRLEGEPAAILAAAPRRFEGLYESPYLAHATLEPPCCTVAIRPDGVEAWIPTQGQDVARDTLAGVLQVPKEKVTIHPTYVGGGFGRKFTPDFVVQAALAAKAAGKPVKLIWRREEDIQHDRYRPGFRQHLRAAVDTQGKLVALEARVATQSLLGQIFPPWVRNGADEASVEGLADTSYAIPHIAVTQLDVDLPIPLGFMRSVGQSPNVFALESLLDEITSATGQDPLAFRRELLRFDRRGLAVLDAAAKLSGWGTAAIPAGRARGLAYRGYVGRGGMFITRVAEVVEVSVDAGRIRVHKVWCAVDCGLVVNPDAVRAQVEGSIGFGLTSVLHGKITFKDGAVEQGSFDDYPLLTLAEMPDIEVHLAESHEAPSGIGEPAIPPLAPAIGSAVFALTGKRLRTLPFRLG